MSAMFYGIVHLLIVVEWYSSLDRGLQDSVHRPPEFNRGPDLTQADSNAGRLHTNSEDTSGYGLALVRIKSAHEKEVSYNSNWCWEWFAGV